MISLLLFFFTETIEEASSAKSEIDRLRDEIEKVKGENSELRDAVHSQQVKTGCICPTFIFNTVLTKGIVLCHCSRTRQVCYR